MVHNSCKVKHENVESKIDAIKRGEDFLKDGYKKVEPGRFVSDDGLRQMRFDFEQNHINLETFSHSYWEGGRNKIIENIHVWFKW